MNNIKRTVSRLQWRIGPIIFAGILLFLLTLDLSGRNGLSRTQALTDNTLDTLRLQCISFHKLESADGTKSLFRLADSVQELSRHLELDPTLASNAYLEDFVDEIRLSGIALLNADLQLEASGYTRQYAGIPWPDGASSARLESLIGSAKIYTQRLEKDGVSMMSAPWRGGTPPAWSSASTSSPTAFSPTRRSTWPPCSPACIWTARAPTSSPATARCWPPAPPASAMTAPCWTA